MIISFEPASRRSSDSIDPIVEAARRHFGIPYLYPIQRFVISNILEQKNQIVVLPTGAGKSLCYQLPARICGGLTVVLVPLLSLLADQLERCREAGLRAEALRGGQSPEYRRRLVHRLRSGAIDLLFATPESLEKIGRSARLGDLDIDRLVVDEAHCISEWGRSFRPAYLHLGEIIRHLKIRCLTAFTATASPRVAETIQEVLFTGQSATVLSADPDRPNIRYGVIPTLSKARTLRLLAEYAPRPLLVFTRTRSGAERAARILRRRFPELEIRFYHAGLTREERRGVETWYKPNHDGILTATSAYGMGVDKPDIRSVIHLDIPYSPESYLQETGRAGRDGRAVDARLLYSAEDLGFAEILAGGSARASMRTFDPLAAERYAQMLGYALNTRRCRREQLLAFQGRRMHSCSGCDICAGTARERAEGETRILDFASRNRRRFTMLQAVQLLKGAKSHEVVRAALDSYDGFGMLADWQEEEIREALESLLRAGKISVSQRGFWKDRLTTGPVFPKIERSEI